MPNCCQLSTVSFLHLRLAIAWVITTSRWARKLDHSKKEGGGKLCFSDAELACRLALQGRKQLFLGANAAVTRCLRRVFSAIKLDQTGIQWRQRLNFTVPSCISYPSNSRVRPSARPRRAGPSPLASGPGVGRRKSPRRRQARSTVKSQSFLICQQPECRMIWPKPEVSGTISTCIYLLFCNPVKILIPKTIGNRKRDCAWGCARG